MPGPLSYKIDQHKTPDFGTASWSALGYTITNSSQCLNTSSNSKEATKAQFRRPCSQTRSADTHSDRPKDKTHQPNAGCKTRLTPTQMENVVEGVSSILARPPPSAHQKNHLDVSAKRSRPLVGPKNGVRRNSVHGTTKS